MDTSKLINIEIDGVDTRDYPDLCDAFISYAEHADGEPLTDDEIDILNESHGDFVYELAMESLH